MKDFFMDKLLALSTIFLLSGCFDNKQCDKVPFKQIPYNGGVLKNYDNYHIYNEMLVNKIVKYHYKNPYKIDNESKVQNIEYVSKNKSSLLFSAINYTDIYFIYKMDSKNCPSERFIFSPI